MYEGRIVGTAARGTASPESLGLLMAGVDPHEGRTGAGPAAVAPDERVASTGAPGIGGVG
jgi:hypothetical protein